MSLFSLALLSMLSSASVRHEAHPADADDDADEGDATHAGHAQMMAAMVGPLDLPMNQNASGTAWQPASSPLYGHMVTSGNWTLMWHYLVFAGLDAQGSQRGALEGFSTNWLMGMAQTPLLEGQLTGRTMLSLEAPLLGSPGYPLLLQTGETSGGAALVDRQHPHDLFMEIALKYNRAVTSWLAFELYVAAVGEPALGPAGFPHRLSAAFDPFAPLGHHWEDSTHISFGVFTAGLYTPYLKLEGSWFNGREPDENRYDLDLRVPDSYSVRLSVSPAPDWSGQISYGFLRAPEFVLEPKVNVHRLTASLTYNQRHGDQNWATTLVWGQNREDRGPPSNAFLAESSFLFGENAVFGRAEYVLKTGAELGLSGTAREGRYALGAVALGYVRQFAPWCGIRPGIGVLGSLDFLSAGLAALYGTPIPLGVAVYVRLQPVEMMSMMME